jgi:hypothetical protein
VAEGGGGGLPGACVAAVVYEWRGNGRLEKVYKERWARMGGGGVIYSDDEDGWELIGW